jgi:hypothetical protein
MMAMAKQVGQTNERLNDEAGEGSRDEDQGH